MAEDDLSPIDFHRHLAAARQHFFADRPEEALRACRAIPPDHPDHPDALHLEALIHMRDGKAGRALTLLDRAITLAPNNPSFHNSRGSLFFQTGAWSDAESAFRDAVAADKALPEPLVNLGNALHAQGRADEAEAAYRQALALNPEDPTILNNLGTAVRDQARLSAALPFFRSALDIQPDNLEALFNQADVHLLQRKWEEAEFAFRRIAEAAPTFVPAIVGVAQSLHGRRRSDDAALLLYRFRASQDEPDHPLLLKGLRSAYGALASPDRLRRLLDPGYLDRLGQALSDLVSPTSIVLAAGEAALTPALLAARAGACSVQICEPERPLALLFEQIVAANGMSNQVTIVPKPSSAFDPSRDGPGPADLFLWDPPTAGPFAPAALFQLRHARAELLGPNATVMPKAATLYAMPADAGPFLDSRALANAPAGLDLRLLSLCKSFDACPTEPASSDFRPLGPDTAVATLDFSAEIEMPVIQESSLIVTTPGQCTGLVIGCDLHLGPTTVYACRQSARQPLWHAAYHALPEPKRVEAASPLSVVVRIDPTGLSVGFGSD